MKHIPWSRIKGMIFDMDGVLVDTERYSEEALRKVCQNNGLLVPESVWKELRGRTNREVFLHILRILNRTATEALLTKLIDEKRALVFELVRAHAALIPGSLPFAQYARQCFPKIGLTTSNNLQIQKYLCDRFRFSPLFDVVVTGQDVAQGKPHPEPYRLTAQRLEVAPSELCVIEDSINGVRSAMGAGCHVVGLTTSYSAMELEKAGAHLTIESFASLRLLLTA